MRAPKLWSLVLSERLSLQRCDPMSDSSQLNPAEQASERALAEVRECIAAGTSFLLEAGAGAGKTYSLGKALTFLIESEQQQLSRRAQKIACITFTNVAKAAIEAHTDHSSIVHCDTIHAFCWSAIGRFQKQLRALVLEIEEWKERLEEAGGIAERTIEYTLGYRGVTDDVVSIHHDDVLKLTVKLMEQEKFRRLISGQYPVILIDEYQDTNKTWVRSIENHFLGQPLSPQFCFFGDHWQKIYGDGCGKIEHSALRIIGKEANFRSVSPIVDCLNRMRPSLPQHVVDPLEPGEVRVFHTNDWLGERKKGPHWGGDLPDDAASMALEATKNRLHWDLSAPKTKILMLTHRVLAAQQGYSSLPEIFKYNDSFTKREQEHIAYLTDHLEPACVAYEAKRYGEMFAALGDNTSSLLNQMDKKRWAESMQRVIELRRDGTVGELIAHLRHAKLPRLPDAVERLEQKLETFSHDEEEMPRVLSEVQKLHQVFYREIVALTKYLQGHSPFETKHGVKGAEFENVLVVVGRGWSRYNFGQMLELARNQDQIPMAKRTYFEDNRNLFYVACSRPKKRLAVLFTQVLSDEALETVRYWFGADNLEQLAF